MPPVTLGRSTTSLPPAGVYFWDILIPIWWDMVGYGGIYEI